MFALYGIYKSKLNEQDHRQHANNQRGGTHLDRAIFEGGKFGRQNQRVVSTRKLVSGVKAYVVSM